MLLKREGLQPAFSFKMRGAYNRMRQLDAAERQRGVIAASAGNHAQGVAMAGRALGIDAVIVMPTTTPAIKVDAVRALGARTVLHGDTFDDAYAHAPPDRRTPRGGSSSTPTTTPTSSPARARSPPRSCARAGEPIDAVFVPVGGGGLIAGIAAYIKAVSPETRDHRRRAGRQQLRCTRPWPRASA